MGLRITIAEYLRRERAALDKHEYRDGYMVQMSSVSGDHSLINANVTAEIGRRLRGGPCRAYESQLRLRIVRPVLYTYADAVAICGRPAIDSDDSAAETVTNPRLIVEVLSPSTEAYDRGEKFERYREIESLQEYVLISQDTPRVETFVRQSGGSWLLTPYSGLTAVARLRSLDIDLPLAEVYAGVEWPAAERPSNP